MAKLATFLRSRQKGWELDRYEFSPWWHKYSMFLNSFLPNLQGEKYSFAEVTLTRLVPFWGDLPCKWITGTDSTTWMRRKTTPLTLIIFSLFLVFFLTPSCQYWTLSSNLQNKCLKPAWSWSCSASVEHLPHIDGLVTVVFEVLQLIKTYWIL